MSLTRKAFLRRASITAAAVAVTSVAGAGTAEAGPSPRMRSLIAELTNVSRRLQGFVDNPDFVDDPNIREDLRTIAGLASGIAALAERAIVIDNS